jgi:hypothetical protein
MTMIKSFWKRLFKQETLSSKKFTVNNTELSFAFLGYASNNLEIWYETEWVKDLLTKMPNAETLQQALEFYKQLSDLNYKWVLIKEESILNENWFYKKNKTWVITVPSILQIVLDSLEKSGVNVIPMDQYLRNQGVIIRKGVNK